MKEKVLCDLFVSRFKEKRLTNKILIINFMRKSVKNSDFIADLIFKILGSAKYNLHEFDDVELGDLLGFLCYKSQVKGLLFSYKTKMGISTLKNWEEWRSLPQDNYPCVKVFISPDYYEPKQRESA